MFRINSFFGEKLLSFKNSKNLKKYINLLHITKLGDEEDASTTLATVNWGILNIL